MTPQTNIIVNSVIKGVRQNPKTTLGDFFKSLENEEILARYKDEILALSFEDFFYFHGATSEEDIVRMIVKKKDWLKDKSMKEIVDELNMPKDLVVKAVNYLRNDTQYPGKIRPDGLKKGMTYTWVDK